MSDPAPVTPDVPRTVLITGVSGFWGSRVAAALMENPAYRVLGLDLEPPAEKIKGLDFIQADIRNNRLLDLMKAEQVKILVHLAFHESGSLAENSFDYNVMGTLKVFGAAAEAGIQKIILRSSTAVYGANPDNSAFLDEQFPLRAANTSGWVRDMVEIEAFCNGFRRQSPEIILTILRFPNVLGPTVDSPMARYLRQPIPPKLLGFEPQMQFLHESDAVDALVHVVNIDAPGVFNVGAEGVTALDKALAITGRLPLPVFHLFAYWGRSLVGGGQMQRLIPMDLDYLRYPWIGDLQRMRTELAFTPKYTAEETLREFAGHLRMRAFLPDLSNRSFDEERLSDTIERRKRSRSRAGQVRHAQDGYPPGDLLDNEEQNDG